MKKNTKVIAVRFDAEEATKIEEKAKEKNLKTGTFLKEIIRDSLKIKPQKNVSEFVSLGNSIQLRFSVGAESSGYKKLIKSAKKNGNSVPDEIRERLEVSLRDTQITEKELMIINKHARDISRLGNLFKLSLDSNLNDEETLRKIHEEVRELSLYLQRVYFSLVKNEF